VSVFILVYSSPIFKKYIKPTTLFYLSQSSTKKTDQKSLLF
jgi:hypothetical protein